MIVFGKSVDVFEKKGKVKSQQFKCLVRLYSQIDFFFSGTVYFIESRGQH